MALDDLRITFRDEFDSLSLDTGTATTEPNIWNSSMHNGYVRSLSGNNEEQIYMDVDYLGLGVDPFSVDNGILSIQAAPSSETVKAATGYDYTSGVLTTQGAFSQTYGYWEVRAQLPEGQGLWPAFWLLNENESWPPELDVMEAIGSETNWLTQTVHTDTGSATSGNTWSTDKLSDGYHTYGMDWTASQITFYLDGKRTFSVVTPADLDSPMYMVLNLAVGGTWPGSPDATTNWANATYNIDYVRVYEHSGIAGTGSLLNPDGTLYVPPPITQLPGLVISNGGDVTGISGASFAAPDTGAATSATYNSSQLGLGTPSSATLTVAHDAQNNVTVTNNGKWNDIKNAAYASDSVGGVTLNNFVAVSLLLDGDQNGDVEVTGAKRGSIVTSGGADRIAVAAYSNGMTDNTMSVKSGAGNDTISFDGANNARFDIFGEAGDDSITLLGGSYGSVDGGAGDDSFVVRSSGAVHITGGQGADRYDLAADARVTIADFELGIDSLSVDGVAPGAVNVRNAGGSTYVDVDGTTVATLSGVTADAIDLGFAEAPVVIPTFESGTATMTSLLTPDSSFGGWPVTHTKLSNGSTIAVDGTSYTAYETGANSSKTYGASDLNKLGAPAGSSVTVAYDAQKNVTVTNNGEWGSVKNVALRSGAMTKMTVNNFAGVDIDLNANQSATVSVGGVKYGSIASGSGNDTIQVNGTSDSADGNLMTISAGNGANSIGYSGNAGNRAAIIAGTGADTITFSGQANGSINAGSGGDRINVRSTGNVDVTGGAGADVFSFIAGAHATIADFKAGEDRIEISGVSPSEVRVRNDGTSTLIDLNGNAAVVLAGVALNAGQINLSYA